MNNSDYTLTEVQSLKTADAILAVCPIGHAALVKVAKFFTAIEGLRETRALVSDHSVARLQATSKKEVSVSNAQQEKTILVTHAADFAPVFKEYANKENNTHLAKALKKFTFPVLIRLSTLALTTKLTAFASTVETLDALKLSEYGVEKDWLPTLKTYMSNFTATDSSKELSKTQQPKATVNFKVVIKKIDGYLLTLTNLLIAYKAKDPEFYADCLKALTETKKTAAKKTAAKKEPVSDNAEKAKKTAQKSGSKKDTSSDTTDTDTTNVKV